MRQPCGKGQGRETHWENLGKKEGIGWKRSGVRWEQARGVVAEQPPEDGGGARQTQDIKESGGEGQEEGQQHHSLSWEGGGSAQKGRWRATLATMATQGEENQQEKRRTTRTAKMFPRMHHDHH